MIINNETKQDPSVLAKVSEDLGEAMVGLNCDQREEWAGRESGMQILFRLAPRALYAVSYQMIA
eukprot:SAG31_NODE_46641_length_253_cov_1.012987_1_plen_64_part_00